MSPNCTSPATHRVAWDNDDGVEDFTFTTQCAQCAARIQADPEYRDDLAFVEALYVGMGLD